MSAHARLESIRRRSTDLALLKEIFEALFDEYFMPETKWFELWLRKYDRDVIAESFEITEGWFRRCNESVEKLEAEGKAVPEEMYKTPIHVLQYVQATMKKVAAAEPVTEEPTTTTKQMDFLDESTVGNE
jgi:hypothetical protein